MNYFFCDASALGKRYAPEIGSSLVNHLLEATSHDRLVMLTQTLGEILSILVRRRNAGKLSAAATTDAIRSLYVELISAGEVRLRPAEDSLVLASLPLIEKHSLNSTDALVLRSALDLATGLEGTGDGLVLVASDGRLLKAAMVEGLEVLNPERDPPERLATFLTME